MVVPCIELGVFFRRKEAVVTKDVAADDNVPLADLLAVKETQVGLLGTNVPSFCVLGSRVRIKPDLPADPREGPSIRKARAYIDDPT